MSFINIIDSIYTNISNLERDVFFNKFKEKGFPNSKKEEWKFSNVEKFLPNDLAINTENIQRDKIYSWKSIKDIDCYNITFIDGFFQEKLSEFPKEVEVLDLKLGKLQYDDNSYEKDEFLNLNLAISQDGFNIKVPNNVSIDKPVYILNISTDENFISTQNNIFVGKNSKIEIIEENITKSDETFYNNSIEVILDDNANYIHHKIQNDEKISIVDSTTIIQGKDSNSTLNTISFKGKFIRNNPSVVLNGKGAICNLNGLSLLNDKSVVDNHTFVYHKEPNCDSNEMYKGIYRGESKGIFNGAVLVHKEAQKTNGFQANNNLLLSDKASINSKPQLEIFADDVKCSHGCTVGELDKESIFYLQARGIPKDKAIDMLTSAFAYEMLENIENQFVKDFIQSKI